MNGPSDLDVDFDSLNNDLLNKLDHRPFKNSCSNQLLIHTCTNQLMNELRRLCNFYYSDANNFNFGMHAFSVVVNSESLWELQSALYAFMCILYSSTINSLVETAFAHLKSRVNYFELQNRNSRLAKGLSEYYTHNSSSNEKKYNKKSKIENVFKRNVGLAAFKRSNHLHSAEEMKQNCLNKMSLFYEMCEQLFEKCKLAVDKCELEEKTDCLNQIAKNPRQGHKLLYFFIHQFSATICLWSKVNTTISNKGSNDSPPPMTLLNIEERFRLMNSMATAENEQKDSLDIFIKRLRQENKLLDKFACSNPNLDDSDKQIVMPSSSLCQLLSSDLESNVNESEYSLEQVQSRRKTNKNDLIRTSNSKLNPICLSGSEPEDYSEKITKRRKKKQSVKGANPPTALNEICTIPKCIEIEEDEEEELDNDDDEDDDEITDDNEKEIVIEREHCNLAINFGFELNKDDMESLDANPNSNVI